MIRLAWSVGFDDAAQQEYTYREPERREELHRRIPKQVRQQRKNSQGGELQYATKCCHVESMGDIQEAASVGYDNQFPVGMKSQRLSCVVTDVSAAIITVGYLVLFLTQPTVPTVQIAMLAAFSAIFPLWFFRYARSLWLAMDIFLDPGQLEADREIGRPGDQEIQKRR